MNELFRALPLLLKQLEDNDEVREAVVVAAWKRIAGESLNQHAIAERLENKRLVVAVRSATWRKHLESLSGQMIFKLNSALGAALVTYIDFRVDEDAVDAATRTVNGGKSDEELREIALENVSPRMREKADAIKDDNLRYQFLLAAGSCLERKKRLANS